jgi:hypothetical protein
MIASGHDPGMPAFSPDIDKEDYDDEWDDDFYGVYNTDDEED